MEIPGQFSVEINTFARRIPDLRAPGDSRDLTPKLKEWWSLADFSGFRAEVKKVFKTEIPLSERSEWEDWFNKDKSEIAKLMSDISAAERQIDVQIYSLFRLSGDEITLLEGAIDRSSERSPADLALTS